MINATDILSARILIVDDDIDAAASLSQLLRANGYHAVTTTNDPHAVHDLHAQNRYDLIMLDVQMPGMDGLQVMESLKDLERDGYLPVITLTGTAGYRVQALRQGARDFLRKPYDIDELLARVRNLIEVRLLYNERTPPPRRHPANVSLPVR